MKLNLFTTCVVIALGTISHVNAKGAAGLPLCGNEFAKAMVPYSDLFSDCGNAISIDFSGLSVAFTEEEMLDFCLSCSDLVAALKKAKYPKCGIPSVDDGELVPASEYNDPLFEFCDSLDATDVTEKPTTNVPTSKTPSFKPPLPKIPTEASGSGSDAAGSGSDADTTATTEPDDVETESPVTFKPIGSPSPVPSPTTSYASKTSFSTSVGLVAASIVAYLLHL